MTSWWKKPEKYYTTNEFAELIGWPARQVRRYISNNSIRARRRGKKDFIIPERELVRWGLLEDKRKKLT